LFGKHKKLFIAAYQIFHLRRHKFVERNSAQNEVVTLTCKLNYHLGAFPLKVPHLKVIKDTSAVMAFYGQHHHHIHFINLLRRLLFQFI
jgi:hypothetical protein